MEIVYPYFGKYKVLLGENKSPNNTSSKGFISYDIMYVLLFFMGGKKIYDRDITFK